MKPQFVAMDMEDMTIPLWEVTPAPAFSSLCENTPELQRYSGEPAQMPSASHGKCGFLDLRFVYDAEQGRSRLAHMERRVPFLVQKALYWDEALPDMPCVIIITTTGCVLQGDRMEMHVRVGEKAKAHVTTQSATKIHMMDAGYAAQTQHFLVEDSAYLEFVPDPVIPHRTSRFAQESVLTVAEEGMAFYAEIVQPGRVHHHADERFGFDLYATTMTIQRPGAARPLFTERMAVEPRLSDVNALGVMNGFDVFGNVFVAAPVNIVLALKEQCQPTLSPDLMSGLSILPEHCGLTFRVLGRTTEEVKREVHRFWAKARHICTGKELHTPFWR